MYEVVIIGAGPAGLMAGYMLLKYGISFAIVEQGKDYKNRSHEEPYDVSYGFGGAGLFSDGKFSYPPAASILWSKYEDKILEESYLNLYSLFTDIGINIEQWHDEWLMNNYEYDKKNGEKYYRHTHVIKSERENILKKFTELFTSYENVFLNTKATAIRRLKDKLVVECGEERFLFANNVIIATGKRSSSDLLRDIEDIRYKKFCEVGVRIECASEYFLDENRTTDLKKIRCIDNKTDIRTFCTCWNGKVIKSLYDGEHMTYNGETVNNSLLSNMGIVVRSNNIKSTLYQNGLEVYKKLKPKKIDLYQYRTGEMFLGQFLDTEIRGMLDKLLKKDAIGSVYGPEIEKYGKYPISNSNLQIAPGIYVVGDGTALFRGLTAAFVSGAYVALKLKKDMEFETIIEKLSVKTSPTETMRTVFTAHSKTNYYAKNVICEHVFRNNMIPINPYRCFGYFLDDRVERDVVRQANNQMVVKCDEVWVYGPISDGVLFEIVNALKFNKPIKFFSVGTKLEDIHEISVELLKFEPEVHAKHIKKSDIQTFIKRKISFNNLK